MRPHLVNVAIVVLGLVAAISVALVFFGALDSPLETRSLCQDRASAQVFDARQPEALRRCFVGQADLFLEVDFAEAKDLSKAFLTLLTAVLVASITFSEKIVGIGTSGWWARSTMVTCWLLLLLAIVACGAALALMATAAGYALYQPELGYQRLTVRAVYLYLTAGVFFGLGLATMLVTGIISLSQRKSSRAPET